MYDDAPPTTTTTYISAAASFYTFLCVCSMCRVTYHDHRAFYSYSLLALQR